MKIKLLELEINAEELNVDRSLKMAFADLANTIAETLTGKSDEEDINEEKYDGDSH